MILSLIKELGLENDIVAHFDNGRSTHKRTRSTDSYIVDRVRDALQIIKQCETEQHRLQFRVGVALIAPRKGDKMKRRVAKRLQLRRGKRSMKKCGRPYAFELGFEKRATFDKEVFRFCPEKLQGPVGRNGEKPILTFQVGERVQSRNGMAEVTRLTPDGGCVLTYRVGESYAEKQFSACVGNSKGSARLRHPSPSLLPEPRAMRCTSTTDSTKKRINEHATGFCSTSPCQRDVKRRYVPQHCLSLVPSFH